MKSTIIIPNYKGITYIEACLQSVFAQTLTDFAVIVVDNASQDGSVELIRDKFPQVRIIQNNENLGFCKAVNIGIKAAQTPYVVLLNNDTTVEREFLHELEQMMEKSTNIFSASAQMLVMKDPTIVDSAGDYYCALGWAYSAGKGKKTAKYQQDKNIFASCGGAAIYRRAVFEQIGYFDENHFAYLEDMDIGYRARIYGYRNCYAHKAKVLHAGSAVSGSRHNAFKVTLSSRNSIYLIYKNMPILQIIINLPFLCAGFLVKTLFFYKKGFGKIYLKGLWEGYKLSISPVGRTKKVRFQRKNLLKYIQIEIELLINIFRRLG